MSAELAKASQNKPTTKSLIGKIQLEKLDDSTGAEVMPKEAAVAKWQRWKINVTTIRNEDSFTPEYRYSYLLDRGGNIVREINRDTHLPEGVAFDDPFEELVAKLDLYLKKDPALIICARRAFAATEQNDDEKVDDYVRRLNRAADACDWEITQRDARIRDQFIQGCLYRRVVLYNATMPDMTPTKLELLVSKAKLEEAIVVEEKRKAAANVKPRTEIAVHAMQAGYAQRRQPAEEWRNHQYNAGYGQQNRNFSGGKRDYQGNPRTCSGCGGNWHVVKTECKAYNDTCNYCKKTGHWSQVCRQKIRDQRTGQDASVGPRQQQDGIKHESSRAPGRSSNQTQVHETTLENTEAKQV